MVEELASIVEELKEKVPLLEEVTNPALQPRHWVQIFEELGVLPQFCPIELQRRRATAEAEAAGEQPDLSALVRPLSPPACCCLVRSFSRRSLEWTGLEQPPAARGSAQQRGREAAATWLARCRRWRSSRLTSTRC